MDFASDPNEREAHTLHLDIYKLYIILCTVTRGGSRIFSQMGCTYWRGVWGPSRFPTSSRISRFWYLNKMNSTVQKQFVSSNTKIFHSHKRTEMIRCILHTASFKGYRLLSHNPFAFLSCFCLLRWRLPLLNPPLITAPIQTFLLKD